MPDDFFESAFKSPAAKRAAPTNPPPLVDVVMVPLADDDTEPALNLAAPEGKSAAELRANLEVASQVITPRFREPREEQTDGLKPQFTVRDLMQATFFAAIGFAILRLVPADMFAGTVGVAAILGLAILTIFKPQKMIFYVAWWTLLAVYVISSIFAVLGWR